MASLSQISGSQLLEHVLQVAPPKVFVQAKCHRGSVEQLAQIFKDRVGSLLNHSKYAENWKRGVREEIRLLNPDDLKSYDRLIEIYGFLVQPNKIPHFPLLEKVVRIIPDELLPRLASFDEIPEGKEYLMKIFYSLRNEIMRLTVQSGASLKIREETLSQLLKYSPTDFDTYRDLIERYNQLIDNLPQQQPSGPNAEAPPPILRLGGGPIQTTIESQLATQYGGVDCVAVSHEQAAEVLHTSEITPKHGGRHAAVILCDWFGEPTAVKVVPEKSVFDTEVMIHERAHYECPEAVPRLKAIGPNYLVMEPFDGNLLDIFMGRNSPMNWELEKTIAGQIITHYLTLAIGGIWPLDIERANFLVRKEGGKNRVAFCNLTSCAYIDSDDLVVYRPKSSPFNDLGNTPQEIKNASIQCMEKFLRSYFPNLEFLPKPIGSTPSLELCMTEGEEIRIIGDALPKNLLSFFKSHGFERAKRINDNTWIHRTPSKDTFRALDSLKEYGWSFSSQFICKDSQKPYRYLTPKPRAPNKGPLKGYFSLHDAVSILTRKVLTEVN